MIERESSTPEEADTASDELRRASIHYAEAHRRLVLAARSLSIGHSFLEQITAAGFNMVLLTEQLLRAQSKHARSRPRLAA